MFIERRFLNPMNYIAFRRLFGSEKNKDILIKFLNEVLKEQLHKEIVAVTFLRPIRGSKLFYKKQSIVDALCKDVDGCQYIIEMAVIETCEFMNFVEKAQYYASEAFISQMNKGGAYEGLKEIIFLAFADFPILSDEEFYKSEHLTTDNKTLECDLNKLSFAFVDLVKFDEQRPKSLNTLSLEEKFYYLLMHADDTMPDELEQLIGQDTVIQKAYHELIGCFWTDTELCWYEAEEKRMRDNKAAMDFAERKGREEGIKEGIEEGIKERIEEGIKERIEIGEKRGEKKGREEGKKEGIEEGIEIGKRRGIKEGIEIGKREGIIAVAKKMLKLGIALVVIREATGLTEEELNYYRLKPVGCNKVN